MNSMNRQRTLAMMTGFERYTKKTRRANVFGRDGAGGAVGEVVRLDRAPLSQSGQRASAQRTGEDAADLFSAAVVQLGGPGSGRGVVRLGDVAPVCGD